MNGGGHVIILRWNNICIATLQISSIPLTNHTHVTFHACEYRPHQSLAELGKYLEGMCHVSFDLSMKFLATDWSRENGHPSQPIFCRENQYTDTHFMSLQLR